MATNLCALLIYVLALGLRVTCRSAPRIRAFPSRVVKKGDTVTIQCSAEFDVDRLRLEGPNSKFWDDNNNDEKRKVSNFTLKPEEFDDGYSYFCRGIVDNVWSEKEDLTLRVIDPKKPTITAYAHEDDPNEIYLVCKAPDPPEETTISSLILFHDNIPFNCTQYSSGQDVYKTFDRNMLEEITCSYVLQVNEYPKYYIDSPKSEKLQLEDVKVQNLDFEHTPCIVKVQESRTDNDVVTASVCGVLVAVLCIVILVYIMNKKKSSKKKEIKKTNESKDSIKVEKSNEAPPTYETTYCSIDECKNTGKYDVEANVPDTELGGDGITYAEINTSALKKRPDTFNASEDMSNLYAKVKKST